jgi:hypothetical protein
MPISISHVVVGEYYNAGNNQLRKVTNIVTDGKGRSRVEYLKKSQAIPGRDFEPGSTRANPARIATFAEQCNRKLTPAEVAILRKTNILLAGE